MNAECTKAFATHASKTTVVLEKTSTRKLHGSRTLPLARASTRVAVPVFLVFSFWVLRVEYLSVYAFWSRVWSAKRDPLLKVAVRGAVCCSGAEVVQVFQGGCLPTVGFEGRHHFGLPCLGSRRLGPFVVFGHHY